MLWVKLYHHLRMSSKRAIFTRLVFCSLKRKRKLSVLLLLSYRCIDTINFLWLFLTVPWVGLQCVILVFPDHIHLCFALI